MADGGARLARIALIGFTALVLLYLVMPTFVIVPMSFLSGTFYSISRLPPEWQVVAQFNPFFYLIDGLRYGFIGRSDSVLWVGVVVVLAVNAGLWLLTQRMFATGYRLKP